MFLLVLNRDRSRDYYLQIRCSDKQFSWTFQNEVFHFTGILSNPFSTFLIVSWLRSINWWNILYQILMHKRITVQWYSFYVSNTHIYVVLQQFMNSEEQKEKRLNGWKINCHLYYNSPQHLSERSSYTHIIIKLRFEV